MTASPYEALATLIERELALVAEGSLDELHGVQRLRIELQNTLAEPAREEDRAALERCGLLQKRLDIELARVRETILLELGQVRHAQRAAAGYAPVRSDARRVRASA